MKLTEPDNRLEANSSIDTYLEKSCAVGIELEDTGRIEDAIAIYELCILSEDLTAMTRLADILSEPPAYLDVQRAKALYKRACMAGHAPACRNLSILYGQLGETEKSERYYKAARDRGDVWQADE